MAKGCSTVLQIITGDELLMRLICCLFKVGEKNDKMAGCFVTYAHVYGCVEVGKQLIGQQWEEPHPEVG